MVMLVGKASTWLDIQYWHKPSVITPPTSILDPLTTYILFTKVVLLIIRYAFYKINKPAAVKLFNNEICSQ